MRENVHFSKNPTVSDSVKFVLFEISTLFSNFFLYFLLRSDESLCAIKSRIMSDGILDI